MGISIHPPDNMCSRRVWLQLCQNKHLTPGIKSDSPVNLFQPMTYISFFLFSFLIQSKRGQQSLANQFCGNVQIFADVIDFNFYLSKYDVNSLHHQLMKSARSKFDTSLTFEYVARSCLICPKGKWPDNYNYYKKLYSVILFSS
ncbi:hypothetical protein Peur_002194 [Populus x canadensis]